MQEYLTKITQGKIICLEQEHLATDINWTAHPKCRGVALKHLVTGENTGGQLSSHLVKIEAGCEISDHVHADNLELHEVLHGDGKGRLADKEIPYLAGASIVIPANTPHNVSAGANDLYLLAKFTPALV